MSSSSSSNWTTRELNRIPSPSAKLRPSTAAVAGGAGGGGGKPPLVLTSLRNGVLTVTMNDPKRLNAWSVVVLLKTLPDLQRKRAVLHSSGLDPHYRFAIPPS